jgi:RNA-directed DNA polymerase
MSRAHRRRIVEALAAAFLAGPWERRGLVTRGREALGLAASEPWLVDVATRVLASFRAPPDARIDRLARFVAENQAVRERLAVDPPHVVRVFNPAPAMLRDEGARTAWDLPALSTPGDVASWLEITDEELEWFADRRGLERLASNERLRHYRYRWVPKRSGGARLLESPKPRLKALQRRILRDVLDRVPPHEAAHGFRRGRGVPSYVGPHVGHAVVMRLDLADFFTSIARGRVVALFCALGYPIGVARLLAALCTNCAPVAGASSPLPPSFATARDLASLAASRARHRAPHLPQGAPTSPAIANLCAYALDVRLSAAASAAGANYTRYADDLAFSGDDDFARRTLRFAALVGAAALEQGFEVNHRKTRVMRRGVQQRLGGLVVNASAAVPRSEFERLEATLFNCVRAGPASQNRDGHADFRAHLRGRIAWVAETHAARGARLAELFVRIDWDDPERTRRG